MCTEDCYATESEANSFAALRTLDGTLYAEGSVDGWRAPAEWKELYAADDSWQMRNLLAGQPVDGTRPLTEAQAEAERLAEQLHATWVGCRGAECP